MKIHLLPSLDKKYLKISRTVERFLDKLIPYYNKQKEKVLKTTFKEGDPSSINYNQFCLEYAELYWARNYWKAVYLFEYEYSLKESLKSKLLIQGKQLKVVSLGAGPAADIVAFMVWAEIHGVFSNNKVQITLVDKSQKQLDLARKIINEVLPQLKTTYFEFKYEKLDVHEWKPTINSIDILVMGHFLTANLDIMKAVLKKSRHSVVGDGDILIMEREKDPVWKQAVEELADLGVVTYSTGIHDDKFEHMLDSFPEYSVPKKITPHYLKARLPEKKYQLDLVTKYFQSWRFQTEDLLNEIFVKDALYEEKPGKEPAINGISEIKKYWKKNPMLQDNINLWIRGVGYGDYNIVCAFDGEFDTPKQHISISGALNFNIDTFHEKVSSLNAHFGTVKTKI